MRNACKSFFAPILYFSVLIFLSACSSQTSAPTDSIELSVENLASTAIAKTQILEDAVSGTMTALAPITTPTVASTEDPVDNSDNEENPTTAATPRPDAATNDLHTEPWCIDNAGCDRLEVKNKTYSQVTLFFENLDTGEESTFSVPAREITWLTIRPGFYHFILTYCDGESTYEGHQAINENWYLKFSKSMCE
ncbi:MAG: hypothetical protein DRI65_16350 [Chloroflexota bacterium]|nr:MAG: hypothetical protein DRI65_16350 [Chloroflexota bacterium]